MTTTLTLPAIVVRFHERFTKCASCNSDAQWTVTRADGSGVTTSCERHRPTWIRRLSGGTS